MNNINEDFISFIWQYRKLPLFLKTTDNQTVDLIHPGHKNTDSGPDFFGAKLKIGDTLWAGNVEIHVKSSDWQKHGHHNDKAYDSVILHVVYEHDTEVQTNSIPVLEIKNFIYQKLADKYYELLSSATWIPCQKNLSSVEQITIKPWLSRIMAERLEHKTHAIREMLANTKMDWETTFFHWFSSCFGFKLNNDAFLMLARSISFKTLMKHQDNSMQMEALLFGQSGLLLKMYEDQYVVDLRTEYEFLQKKYNLIPIDPKIWKFMRTRPGNFPTIRISQFAQIISRMNHLLSEMFGQVQAIKIRQLLQSQTTPYWESHYNFDRKSEKPRPKHLGNLGVDNLIINAVVPFVFLYGQFHDKDKFRNAAIEILENIAPEDNHILKKWKTLGIEADNSAESQALIELYNNYCSKKKCLSCSIGASLLLDIN